MKPLLIHHYGFFLSRDGASAVLLRARMEENGPSDQDGRRLSFSPPAPAAGDAQVLDSRKRRKKLSTTYGCGRRDSCDNGVRRAGNMFRLVQRLFQFKNELLAQERPDVVIASSTGFRGPGAAPELHKIEGVFSQDQAPRQLDLFYRESCSQRGVLG